MEHFGISFVAVFFLFQVDGNEFIFNKPFFYEENLSNALTLKYTLLL